MQFQKADGISWKVFHPAYRIQNIDEECREFHFWMMLIDTVSQLYWSEEQDGKLMYIDRSGSVVWEER